MGTDNKKKEVTDIIREREQLLQDFRVMRSIIESCALKGSFAANELLTVGNVYNRLGNYITNIVETGET